MRTAYSPMLPIYPQLAAHRKAHEDRDQHSIPGPRLTFCVCIFTCNFSRFPRFCLLSSSSTSNLLNFVSHKIVTLPV